MPSVRPRIPRAYIERPSLIADLDQGSASRITLISAPAGYGKSTVTAQWLEKPSAMPSAWLSMDARDADLEQFARRVIAALHSLYPEFATGTEGLLSAANLPSPEQLAASLSAELAELEGRTILVLDDYGLVRSEDVHALVSGLVRELPDTIHLVILSRIDPPLPLEAWRARRWISEFRAGDLRFSPEEVRAFLQTAERLDLSEESVDILHELTEGWPAGLRLAALSLSESAHPDRQVQAFTGRERLVVDYFMEQVLAAQSAEVREFLAVTAPLERFCAPLCDELLAGGDFRPESQRLLDRIHRDNLFLVALGPREGWYRYHHLFRDLLLGRLDELAPAIDSNDVRRKAAAWFQRQGWLEEALQLFVEAGDIDAAADLVAQHLHGLINRDLSRRSLARWLSTFPVQNRHERLPLVVASLYLMVLRWDIEGMLKLLEESEAVFTDVESDRHIRWRELLRADVEALRAYALYWAGDPAGALDHASRVLVSPSDPRGYQYSLALIYRAAGLALTGRRREHSGFVEEGISGGIARGGQHVGPLQLAKCAVHLYAGELELCRSTARTMLEVTDAMPTAPYYLCFGHYFKGVVAYERNQLEEAQQRFREIEALRFEAARLIYHHALLALAEIALAGGDHDSAHEWAMKARDFAGFAESPTLLTDSEWLERKLALAMGGERTFRSPPPTLPDFMRLSLEVPFQAWAWLRLNDPAPEGWETTLRAIESALGRASTFQVQIRVVQLSVLRSLALDRLERRDEAITELERAVRLAAPRGLVRSFLDRGPPLRSLLQEAAMRQPGDFYLRSLLEAFREPSGGGIRRAEAPAGPRHASWVDLTNRELDVLELLQQRMTNKEIATRLTITPATVTKHALNIYRKLGVHGRRQAVAEATERGILSPRSR